MTYLLNKTLLSSAPAELKRVLFNKFNKLQSHKGTCASVSVYLLATELLKNC